MQKQSRARLLACFLLFVFLGFNIVRLANTYLNQNKYFFYNRDSERFSHLVESFNILNDKAPIDVLFYGSSSIQYWQKTIHKDFPELHVAAHGMSGGMMHDLLYYFDKVVMPYEPKALVIYAGENDISSGVWEYTVYRTFKSLFYQVESVLPQTDVYFISIKPTPYWSNKRASQQKVNTLIASWAKNKNKLHYVEIEDLMIDSGGDLRHDMYLNDGQHMSKVGYDAWVNKLQSSFVKNLK